MLKPSEEVARCFSRRQELGCSAVEVLSAKTGLSHVTSSRTKIPKLRKSRSPVNAFDVFDVQFTGLFIKSFLLKKKLTMHRLGMVLWREIGFRFRAVSNRFRRNVMAVLAMDIRGICSNRRKTKQSIHSAISSF